MNRTQAGRTEAARRALPGSSLGARWLLWPLLAAAAATVFRAALEPLLAGERPLQFATPAVLLVTLAAGWGPGALCLVIAHTAMWLLFIPAHDRFAANELAGLAVSTSVAALVIIVAESHRRLRLHAQREARRAHRAVEAVRESEERFRRLAELSPDAILVLKDDAVVYANQATLRLLRAADITQVLGHSPLELVHPSSRHLLHERWSRLLKTGQPNPPAEQQYYRFDGSIITVETVSSLVPWGGPAFGETRTGGGPAELAVQVIARDVTERLRAQQALRESTQALEQFFEDSPVPIHQLDADGRILRANRAELELLGYDASEYIGHDVREFYADPAQADEILRCLRAGQTLRAHPISLRRKNGEHRWVLLDANALWRDGRMVHSRCFMIDVTEQRRAEAQVQTALDRFRLSARATNDVIYDWDLQAGVVEWNDAVHTLLGDGDRQEMSRPEWWNQQVHPDDLPALQHSLEATLKTGEQWTGEYRFRRADGTYRSVLDRAFIVRDPSGAPVRVVGALIDLTERKRHEEEIARRSAALQASNTELQDFADIISHDLREPLRGIAQYAGALNDDLRDELSPQTRDRLATISRLAQRMTTLLDALSEYGRIGRAQLRKMPSDLNAIVRDVLDLLRARIEADHAEIVLSGELPVVTCDPLLMQQVFSNLIANALKYNISPHKRVEIGWLRPGALPHAASPRDRTQDESWIGALYIRDNGIGIDPRHHNAVFKMFKRLHARDRFGGGTGSGLSIVRKIVERHGGQIWIDSKAGHGSTFYIALPEPEAPEPPDVHVETAATLPRPAT